MIDSRTATTFTLESICALERELLLEHGRAPSKAWIRPRDVPALDAILERIGSRFTGDPRRDSIIGLSVYESELPELEPEYEITDLVLGEQPSREVAELRRILSRFIGSRITPDLAADANREAGRWAEHFIERQGDDWRDAARYCTPFQISQSYFYQRFMQRENRLRWLAIGTNDPSVTVKPRPDWRAPTNGDGIAPAERLAAPEWAEPIERTKR